MEYFVRRIFLFFYFYSLVPDYLLCSHCSPKNIRDCSIYALVEEFGAHCLVLGSPTRAPFAFTIPHRALAFIFPLDILLTGRQVLDVNSTLFYL
jgi:hypothetical protein